MTSVSDKEMRSEVSSAWWVPLAQGIAAIIFGCFALFRTEATLAIFMFVLGFYWIINGIFTVVYAVSEGTGRSKTLQLIVGSLLIVIGFVAVFHPSDASQSFTTALAIIVGVTAIIGGIIQMVTGGEGLEGSGFRWSWNGFFMGLLNLIFGILVVSAPFFSYKLFVQIIAFWGILGGCMLLYMAYRMRSQS